WLILLIAKWPILTDFYHRWLNSVSTSPESIIVGNTDSKGRAATDAKILSRIRILASIPQEERNFLEKELTTWLSDLHSVLMTLPGGAEWQLIFAEQYKKTEIAADRIRDAFNRKLNKLDLSNLRLGLLPNVFHLSVFKENLFTLNCSKNPLSEDLGNICSLTKLTDLNVEGCGLEKISADIGNCQSLLTLNLSHNVLSTLPDTIGNCQSLLTLNLSHNMLRTLPDTIGNCQSLVFLDLSHNYLHTLPDTIGNVKDLGRINCSFNYFMYFPKELLKCEHLRSINFSHNKLKDAKDPAYKALLYLKLFKDSDMSDLDRRAGVGKVSWFKSLQRWDFSENPFDLSVFDKPEPPPLPVRKQEQKEVEARQTLGVSPNAPWPEIKAAHRKMVREIHPDTVVNKFETAYNEANKTTEKLSPEIEKKKKAEHDAEKAKVTSEASTRFQPLQLAYDHLKEINNKLTERDNSVA
ncbi:MAG: hypothetical protein WCH62_09365, partial [Candidatus Omnitrophota bacterium]